MSIHQLQCDSVFLFKQSYAGKYVPAIGYKIHTSNPTASLKINLAGISIGDALIDPETVRNIDQMLIVILLFLHTPAIRRLC